jgi:hypothetical protein
LLRPDKPGLAMTEEATPGNNSDFIGASIDFSP